MVALSNVTQFQTKAGKAIEDFLQDKLKRSEDTASSYRSDISIFLNEVFDKTINTVTVEELEILDYDSFNGFLNSLHGKKANGTINRRSSSVESLYKHLNKTKVIRTDLSFFSLIKALPNEVNSYEVMPMEVVEEYLEAVRYEKHNPVEKKWAIILAVELGLRDSEVRELEWSQFKPDGDRVYVTGYGKGKKKYTEVISRNLYNNMVAELRVDGQKQLFTITKKNITDMMIRLRKVLKHEDRNYTFHSFKKTSVNNTFNITGNILDAQSKGKHSKLETTQIYLKEAETKMTGYFSLSDDLNHNLYKEVEHKTLLDTLNHMPKELLFLLNMKLNEQKNY